MSKATSDSDVIDSAEVYKKSACEDPEYLPCQNTLLLGHTILLVYILAGLDSVMGTIWVSDNCVGIMFLVIR